MVVVPESVPPLSKEVKLDETDHIPSLHPEDPLFGLSDEQVKQSLDQFGKNEIFVPETGVYVLFIRQFIEFLPLLIEGAALISLGIGDYMSFGIIVAMLLVNACLGFREEYHAKKSLDDLSHELESEITTRRNGNSLNINTSDIVPGDVILLVGGVVVPADTQWIKGDTVQVDTAAMTGEPIPRKYPSEEHGNIILSGTTIVAGECYGRVLRTGANTEIGKAQSDILEDKTVRIVSVFQKKIMMVVQVLVSASLALVISVLLVKGFVYHGFQNDVQGTVLDALSIMIASIPIALPLVLQVNLALGASYLAKNYHAIVTSIPALQDIASMSMLCSDKTGTLTTANMSIITNEIYATNGFKEENVILYAYLCSNTDKKDDPIDQAVINAFQESRWKGTENDWIQTEIIGFNPSVKRVVAFVSNRITGKTITIAKGLPAKILNTGAGAADDHELQWEVENLHDRNFLRVVNEVDKNLSNNGYKTIGIAICEGNARELGKNAVWKFAGLLPMLDPPRKDTPATIESLHRANISVKMITGDHVNVGKETARMIGLGTNIQPGEDMRNVPSDIKKQMIWDADGFAAVLPSDKRDIVLILRNHYGLVTGMTGDGVNDAPALSAAQVGIAVEGATDAAKNAADLVLTEPGLSPIYGAVLESRRIFSRIKSYVVYRVAASIVLVLTLSIIVFSTGCSVDPLFVIVMALLNDISMIPVAYDNAKATTKPQLPKARTLVATSLYYGIVQTALSLAFIFSADYDEELKHPIDLEECTGEARGFVWYQLILVTEFMIFSVRAPSLLFLSMPSVYLILSVLITCIVGGLIACLADGTNGLGLHADNMGWITIFNIGTLVFVDIGKYFFRKSIGESPGDQILNDDLIEPQSLTEAQKTVRKNLRFIVHNESVLPLEERQHVVEVRRRRESSLGGFFGIGTDLTINDGFVSKSNEKATMLNRPVVMTRDIPGRRSKQVSSPF